MQTGISVGEGYRHPNHLTYTVQISNDRLSMRQLSVISKKVFQDNPDLDSCSVLIHDKEINFAIVETDDIEIDFDKDRYREMVLVRKRAFSLNYRDTSLIIQAALYFEQNPESLEHFPVGSDFVAEVIKTGVAVKGISVGDRVIPDSFISYANNMVASGIPSSCSSKELDLLHYTKLKKIPSEMPDDVAAGFTTGGQTAFSMIRKVAPSHQDIILITAGSSNTSLFVINALIKTHKNLYVLTGKESSKLKLKDMGIENVLLVDPLRPFHEQKDILEVINSGVRFNVIFDPFFDLYFPHLVTLMAPLSRYVFCGLQYQHALMQKDERFEDHTQISTIKLAHILIQNNTSVIGNCLGNSEDLDCALMGYKKSEFDVTLASIYTDNDVASFIHTTFVDRARFGKVIMKYSM